MFKRSNLKQKANEVTLEVKQYGKIVPSEDSPWTENSVKVPIKGSIIKRPIKSNKFCNRSDVSFDGGSKPLHPKAGSRTRTPSVVPQRRPVNHAYSRAAKETSLENRSTADTKSMKTSNEGESQDNISDLIEKAKKELEENQQQISKVHDL